MEAGHIYKFLVDCSKSSISTFSDIADAIVEKMNEVLDINTEWVHHDDNDNQPLIFLPDTDFTINRSAQRHFVLRVPYRYNNTKSNGSYSMAVNPEINEIADGTKGGGATIGYYYYGDAKRSKGSGTYGPFGTGQIMFIFDTTRWTSENKTYEFSIIMTDEFSGETEVPETIKFAQTTFFTQFEEVGVGRNVDVFITNTAGQVTFATVDGVSVTKQPSPTRTETSFTLHKVATGAYSNDYFYYLNLGDVSLLKEYLNFDMLPYISETHREIKAFDKTYDAYLKSGIAGDNSCCIVIKP
jgi:hypothetical protein